MLSTSLMSLALGVAEVVDEADGDASRSASDSSLQPVNAIMEASAIETRTPVFFGVIISFR